MYLFQKRAHLRRGVHFEISPKQLFEISPKQTFISKSLQNNQMERVHPVTLPIALMNITPHHITFEDHYYLLTQCRKTMPRKLLGSIFICKKGLLRFFKSSLMLGGGGGGGGIEGVYLKDSAYSERMLYP